MTREQERGSTAVQLPAETPQEKYERIRREILVKVQSDITHRRLYVENALFRQVVELVANGGDPWEIIPKLIDINIDVVGRFQKMLVQWPSQTPPVL